MADSLSSFAVKLDRLAERLGGDAALKSLATKLGVFAKKDAEKAASADLGGDPKFSGWAKAPLTTRFEHTSPGVIEFGPQGKARGPWRVAESGRRAGMSKGTRKRKPRNMGATAGKDSWSDAMKIMEAQTPGRVQDEVVQHLRKTFGS